MSKSSRNFKGDDGKRYRFIKRTFKRKGQRVCEIVVKYRGQTIKAFKLMVGLVSTFMAFEAWIGSGFALSKGAILLFAFAGL